MVNNTLSVIISNYNHAKFIGKALDAILSQSYRPMEVIIIDDTSTDNSVEIIEKFIKKDPIIRLIVNEKNMGAVYNYMRLLELAQGDYVYGAAADDMVLPGFFEKSLDLLMKNPQAGLCSAISLFMDKDSKNKYREPHLFTSKKEGFYIPPEKALSILRKEGSWIEGNTTIYRRKAFMDSGGFIPELHAFCDGFIQQVITLKYGACFIPEPLACWRLTEGGYATTFSRDPDVFQKAINHAVYLMKNRYNDVFPQDYIVQWQKEQLYAMHKNTLLTIYRQKTAYLQNSLPPQTILDKTFRYTLLLVMKCEFLVSQIYLLAFYKITGAMLKQKLRKVIRNAIWNKPVSCKELKQSCPKAPENQDL